MTIQVCHTDDPELSKSLTNVAIRGRLYSRPDWALYATVYPFLQEHGGIIAIALEGIKPVGVAVVVNTELGIFVQVFVKRSHRRQGIGTRLFQAVSKYQQPAWHGSRTRAGDAFYARFEGLKKWKKKGGNDE